MSNLDELYTESLERKVAALEAENAHLLARIENQKVFMDAARRECEEYEAAIRDNTKYGVNEIGPCISTSQGNMYSGYDYFEVLRRAHERRPK